jgi:mono/diheme cytochrome c family protein
MMHIKFAVSILFMAAGTGALLTMLYVMGRPEKKINPGAMKTAHRLMGLIFVISLVLLAWIGARFAGAMGDGMSLRVVFHAVFATSLIAVVLMKILIVKSYRELMRFVPAMGLVIFALAFVVFITSTGFHIARDLRPGSSEVIGAGQDEGRREDAGIALASGEASGSESGPAGEAGQTGEASQAAGESMPEGDVKAGRAIFNNKCVGCHNVDSRKSLFGPGLAGLMKMETLRSTGQPPTPDNIRQQLLNPVGTMPAFTTFSNREMNDLLAYLGTL